MPQPTKKTYKTGETVFGLWPGSGGLYFKGVVVENDAVHGTYDVKFEEGTTYTLLEKHVKPVDSFKSLEPKSSQRQVRRRARSSSVSRSRSRSRTPGRKPRGKSPVKDNKTASNKSPKQEKESKLAVKKSSDSDVEDSSPTTRMRRPSRKLEEPKEEPSLDNDPSLSPKRRGRPRKLEAPKEEPSSLDDVPLSRRRSTRLVGKNKQVYKEESEDSADKSSEPTKPNGKEQNDTKSEQEMDSGDDEVVAPLNTFRAILITMSYLGLVVFLHLICKHNKCLFKGIPQFNLATFLSLYNPFVSFCVEGFYLTIFLLSMLPTGEVLDIDEGQLFRRNSLVSATTLISTLLAAKHYFQISASKIMTHLPQFLIPTIVVGFIVAVFVSFRNRGNRTSDTGILSHFVIGSSVNVSLAGVNIKVWVHRAIFITVIALHCLALEANFEQNQTLSASLALVSAMQIIYAIEALWNDTIFLNSYEFTHLKTGWMYLSMLAHPFMAFLITLSVINSGLELPYYCLAPVGVLFLAGLWIKVGSNSQKAAFIKDPNHPSFANMESLTSTSDGKLLISGWWGWLRHPNYLGDILMHLAFALPCGFQMFLPYTVLLFAIVCFLYQAIENDSAGKLKYGPSWDRYCQRVPSRVLPRVF